MADNFETLFEKRFPKFGVNKSREIFRLIKEISKISQLSDVQVLNSITENNYEAVKNNLLQKRYPKTFHFAKKDSFYLPKYAVNPDFAVDIKKPEGFGFKTVFYEPSAKNTTVFENVKKLFPAAAFTEIESLKSYTAGKDFTLKDYNSRGERLFLVKEKYDFFKKCPCTKNVVNCGYSIMNLGMGCIYDCTYCFLQAYQNIGAIVLPCNIEDYLKEEKLVWQTSEIFNYKRIGSGEFTDSLIFDHITNFSKDIIAFFKKRHDIFFEFKTKSVNIKNLLNCGGQKNIVAAWSVNSQKMCEENELKTPPLAARLSAARECAKAGFSTAFHFDPIIFYDGWKEGYKETIDMIFDTVAPESIKWISLGTLRMPAAQKQVMENRFPKTNILNGEFLLGQDYKLRYAKSLRVEIYKYIAELIKAKKSKAVVYLCMEDENCSR
ncbi:SPL family radical SAM protein [Endomicrobium proavitum]|uniref:DNA repair photolyase-like protein n=1 Tax=Endomicrobium proavitum TaxID=1408281 RepID=A0A0G3WKG6_9BACT|nr:hypothetical protein [Endomicrobium proavitum]AKL98400.1 DNA repair photolyase-like protein [Endomicrobium proavitum]